MGCVWQLKHRLRAGFYQLISMLKLLFFVPCEKMIIGQDNRTSLISVLEHLFLKGEVPDNLPPNAGFPLQWSAVALWNRTEELVKPISFDSKAELIAPDGTIPIHSIVQFNVSNSYLNYRNIFAFPVFPIGQNGIYKATLSYKRSDLEDWQMVGEYPIQVIHKIPETENETEHKIESRIEDEQLIESV